MSPEAGGRLIFLFDSSTHVFWAEEVAREDGIPVEVVPAPEEAKGSCDLAIRTVQDWIPAFEKLLRTEGIAYQLFR